MIEIIDQETARSLIQGTNMEWDTLPIFTRDHGRNVQAVFRRKADGRHFMLQWDPACYMPEEIELEEVSMRVEQVESWLPIDQNPPVPAEGWYGFDIDATLAYYDFWKGPDHIGEPILLMVEKLKEHLAKGDNVKIFTARVAVTGGWSPYSCQYASTEFARHQTEVIEAWCLKHIGVILPITAVKDFSCIAIYDDRAKQVVPNTGVLVEEQATLYRQL
jgi:hypothetical protein